jgi:hypothetical protein|tara:strand:+ start:192 stop:503 length:312 start_codon:yes stop_codon:yes gene_type:complete
MTDKNKTTILERAIDGARRIIKPMTKEEEYKNADVPIPKEHKKFNEWLVTDLTDEVDDLKSRIQLAALAINQLNTNLLQRDKEIDRLNEELQLAEIALNPAKK